MIRQDRKSWEKGRADGARATPAKCPKGFDELAYASGYVEGNAEPAKCPRLRVVTSSKAMRTTGGRS
jgi:hypothetical protein